MTGTVVLKVFELFFYNQNTAWLIVLIEARIGKQKQKQTCGKLVSVFFPFKVVQKWMTYFIYTN